VLERARLLALPARIIARTGGDAIALKGETPLALADLRAAHEAWLPQFMAGPH
jgi:phosphoribosylformylglycinamidine synthase